RVTARVRVADAEVNGYYAAHRSRSQPVTIDRGTAGQIRTELLSQRQKAAMKAWLARVRKRFAISYSPGYAPVSEVSLGRRIWRIPAHGSCDLPVGSYSFANAAKHGCLGDNAVLPGAPDRRARSSICQPARRPDSRAQRRTALRRVRDGRRRQLRPGPARPEVPGQ